MVNALLDTVVGDLEKDLLLSAVYKEGVLVTDERRIICPKILFDSGALFGSYMGSAFYDRHKRSLAPHSFACSSIVTLADNVTTMPINTCVSLLLEFSDDLGFTHFGLVKFYVLQSCSHDVILGLPHIVLKFQRLFTSMIYDAAVALSTHSSASSQSQDVGPVNGLNASTQGVKVSESDSVDVDSCIYPWTVPFSLDSEEDSMIPEPVQFDTYLSYMEQSNEEALNDYLSAVRKGEHIHPAFAQATNIIHLLQTKGAKVFIPQNWEGISGIDPIELQWSPNLPKSIKPAARYVNPRIYPVAKREMERLRKYMYVPSESPIASPIVVAPKATNPFIRMAGDFQVVNKYILSGHVPIPNVMHALERIAKFGIFADLDWVNAFHQLRLGPVTSSRLSVQTPWGQFQPLFMPEGVSPATGHLQNQAASIFSDFDEWIIPIFDNLLVLAYDYTDLYGKLERVFDRCIERNLFLKFSKSYFGFSEAKFFGYLCKQGTYELTDERKQAINDIPFPTSMRKMQSFLGAIIFFKNFIPNFATLTAALYEMTTEAFDWKNRASWVKDYEAIFMQVKLILQSPSVLHYPDYDLPWLLRTDASDVGCGGCVFMIKQSTDGTQLLLPLCFVSKKFSHAALNWDTIKKEAFSIFYTVLKHEYYLRCKKFIVETDHNNLIWMEKSISPIIIRMRIYLQSFDFVVRHIPAKLNVLADFFSRSGCSPDSIDDAVHFLSLLSGSLMEGEEVGLLNEIDQGLQLDPRNELLLKVHNARVGHWGARATLKKLDSLFPGHAIPFQHVVEFVSTCPICQKLKHDYVDKLEPLTRNLRHVDPRHAVGVDTLTVTPADSKSNSKIIVVVVHFTKFAMGYAFPEVNAINIASALFQFFCSYGIYQNIITDPGSEFGNEIVQYLTDWFGIKHIFSLVDRHQSNGVESTNKQILRHLKALVHSERAITKWSDPTMLSLVFYLLNSHVSSETGYSPYELMFGTRDARFAQLPSKDLDAKLAPKFLRLLNEDISSVIAASRTFQKKLVEERSKKSAQSEQNLLQAGDFILRDVAHNTVHLAPSKLSPAYTGPYIVIKQEKNDITVRHCITDVVSVLHVEQIKRFYGTLEEAKAMAMIDKEQFEIDIFLGYKGDPMKRSSLEFLVRFKDNEEVWLTFCPDVTATIQFEDFCRAHSELQFLLISLES